MTITTRLTESLDIRQPILLAPMAGVSGGGLAAAVSGAGGLGMIGGGYGDADWLEAQFTAVGNARVGVGFITWSLARQPELLVRALDHAPACVMLSFGDIAPFAPAIKAAGVALVCQVQTVAEARRVVDQGADIVVAQGTEAGGHGGARATLPLVPAVVDALGGAVPVVAAGGIADGRGLAAALMLGADGVLMGTRFYAAAEALAAEAAQRRLVAASGDATLRGPLFDLARGIDWPAAYTMRTLENDFSHRWKNDPEAMTADIGNVRAAYDAARDDGDFNEAAVIAGEAADLVDAITPAAEIVAAVAAEAEALLRTAAERL